MPKQTYPINTRNDIVGQIYGLFQTSKVIDSWQLEVNVDANDKLQYGAPVLRSGERTCKNFKGVVADQAVEGIAIRQVHRENDNRPAKGNGIYDNESSYVVGTSVAVLRYGAVNVQVAEAVVYGSPAFYDPVGETYQATATTPTAYQLTNCIYDSSGAAGEVVQLRIVTIEG